MPDHWAKDIEPRKVDWLWSDRIPRGMLTVVAGRPGQGKSTFAAYVAADVSQFGEAVVFSSAEDSAAHVTRPRLQAAGANMGIVRVVTGRHPVLPNHLEDLARLIKRYDASLVVLDPVTAHLGPSLSNSQQVRKALTSLTELLEVTGCACLMVHHTIKSVPAHSDPLLAFGGAVGGLAAAARVAYAFGPLQSGEEAEAGELLAAVLGERADDVESEGHLLGLACVKCNVAEFPIGLVFDLDSVEMSHKGETFRAGRLRLVGERDVDALTLLRGRRPKEDPPDKRAEARDWLVETLAQGPRKVEDLKLAAKVASLAWRTLRRAADEIGIVKSPHGHGPGSHTTWSLPPDRAGS